MFSASDVKDLREKTGAGMMDCKKALTEVDGDMEKAVDWLREKGIAKAEKKASRIAAEGLSQVKIDGNKAVILEVNCETDFVSKNENFISFIDELADVLLKNSVDLPLESISTVNKDNRYEKGLEIQKQFFGAETIQAMIENTPEGQERFNDFLSAYCFGDFYTRDALSNQDRELITFCILATLGGCENQLRGHVLANLNVGNDKEVLIDALTILLPYIGFPRTLNALAIINEY